MYSETRAPLAVGLQHDNGRSGRFKNGNTFRQFLRSTASRPRATPPAPLMPRILRAHNEKANAGFSESSNCYEALVAVESDRIRATWVLVKASDLQVYQRRTI